MKLQTLGSNQTQLELTDGTRVLFSYNTPVAAYIIGKGYVRTEKRWSNTTSKHINAWIGHNAENVPQSFLDNLVK